MNHHALHRLFSFFYTLSIMDKLYVIFMTIKKCLLAESTVQSAFLCKKSRILQKSMTTRLF